MSDGLLAVSLSLFLSLSLSFSLSFFLSLSLFLSLSFFLSLDQYRFLKRDLQIKFPIKGFCPFEQQREREKEKKKYISSFSSNPFDVI